MYSATVLLQLLNVGVGITKDRRHRVQYLQQNKFPNQNRALRSVLFEICEQLEESPTALSDEYEDAETFFSTELEGDDSTTESPDEEVAEQLFFRAKDERSKQPSLTNCFDQDF